MSRIFKVSCEFFVIANNTRDVFDYCGEDSEFIEKHIVVEAVEKTDDVEIFEDLTKEGGE